MTIFNKSMAFEFAKELHETLGYPIHTKPAFINDTDTQELILDSIEENLGELKRVIANKDLEGVIAVLGGLDSVVNQAALRFGVNLPLLAEYTHQSNMSRVCSDKYTARLGKERYAEKGIATGIVQRGDLYFLYSKKDGKILKSPGYKEPNIVKFIKECEND